MIAAPHLPMTLDCAGSMEIVPTSPQSRFSAQRPEANSGRVSETSRFSSSGGPYLRRLLEEVERLAEGLVVDQRRHVRGVEEGALAGALRLGHRADDVGDEPVALRVALLGDAGAEIRRAVAVHVLAVHGLGDREIFVPGLRHLQAGRLQDVLAVVHHVEVAVEA